MTTNSDDNLPLTALFQALIEPQASCLELQVGPIMGFLLDPLGGNWDIRVIRHRVAVTFRVDMYPYDTNTLKELLRNAGLHISTLLLQAQSLYSGQVLRLSGYTMTTQVGQEGMQPFWVHLDALEDVSPIVVDNEHLETAANVIAKAAIYTGHENLQRALRDYEQALTVNAEDRLIYLWRATEEILWAHYQPKKGAQLPKTPPYGAAAKDLGLYWVKKNKDEWTAELARLAHNYARHAMGALGRPTLPAKLDECVNAAQARVVELIQRHAQFLAGHEGPWDPPNDDVLKGWP